MSQVCEVIGLKIHLAALRAITSFYFTKVIPKEGAALFEEICLSLPKSRYAGFQAAVFTP
jgi:hypothetical protein